MTAREVLQRLVDACVAWDGTSTIDGGEDERNEYFESRDEAVAYLAQPEPQDDARDAARYRWLRDNGDATWIPLAKRYKASAELDRYIDAAMAKESAK